ncbi:unnamed protein product [Urochloa humidicola]
MRMASSSMASGSKGNQLQLIECPSCGVPVVKIRSNQKETYGQFFFKCPNNIKGDPSTCGFIRSEQQYESYVHGLERNKNDEVEWARDGNKVLRWQCAELMQAITCFRISNFRCRGAITCLRSWVCSCGFRFSVVIAIFYIFIRWHHTQRL